jgi:hypothetical protein
MIAGSMLVTGLPTGILEQPITYHDTVTKLKETGLFRIQLFKRIGPCLNPAIGLGIQLTSF